MKKDGDQDNLLSVWRVPDEPTGLLLREVLAEQGVRSLIRSDQVAWMDNVMKTSRGYWGSLLVFASEAARARKIIEEFLKDDAGKDADG